MSETKHAPGPWGAGCNERGQWLIQSTDGDGFTPPWAYQKATVAAIAPREDAAANARLIAAAPEMFAALRDIVSLLDAPDPVQVGCHCTETGAGAGITPNDGVLACCWCKAKAVIAKAWNTHAQSDPAEGR